MHIPASQSQDVALLDFEEALARSGKSGGYDASKWLYVPDFYTEYRYILGTRGDRPLICIGVNPSTAAPDALDNTLKSVERIARYNGYDSFLMFNVYAQRATRPQDMDAERSDALHRENLSAFRYALSSSRDGFPSVWAAWGSIIELRPWLPGCVEDMIALGEEYGARWYTAGPRSKKGHPHHPLYLRADSTPEPFDVRDYCAALQHDL